LARAAEVTTPQIVRAVKSAAGDTPIRSISVALVGDRDMASLHRQYLGDPETTDVLTFDLRDDRQGPELEGEIAVCVDAARRQARRWRVSVSAELLRYVIHGVLHLLGYDDDLPARRRRMRRQETRVLAMLKMRSTHHE
jgi:probable rRNA maturation factor